MIYDRTPMLDLVDAYAEVVGYSLSNLITHLVTEDYNLSDHNIDFQLQWIEEQRVEWLAEGAEITCTENDIRVAIAFLHFLKAFPEDVREAHCWEDEVEPEQPIQNNPPGKSATWLKRHGEL